MFSPYLLSHSICVHSWVPKLTNPCLLLETAPICRLCSLQVLTIFRSQLPFCFLLVNQPDIVFMSFSVCLNQSVLTDFIHSVLIVHSVCDLSVKTALISSTSCCYPPFEQILALTQRKKEKKTKNMTTRFLNSTYAALIGSAVFKWAQHEIVFNP